MPEHVAGLALIGRHAQRGIAFQMLDGELKFSLMGQLHVLDRHIVLLVDPRPALAFMHIPQGAEIAIGASSALGRSTCLAERPSPDLSSTAIACRLTGRQSAMGRQAHHLPRLRPPSDRSGPPVPGTKAAISSRHSGRERWCEVMLTLGFQPPDTPKAVHADGLRSCHWPAAPVTDFRPSLPPDESTTCGALQMPQTGQAGRRLRGCRSRRPHPTPLACKSRAVRTQTVIVVGEHRHAVAYAATPQRLA